MRALILFPLVLALTPFAPTGAQASSPAPRPLAFAQCSSCHSVEPGKTVFGPSLHGVGGRRAGSLPGFDYSAALRNSWITWNAATLDRWLASPQKTVPGTRMPFGGIRDRAARKALVDYLLTIR